MIQPQYAQPYAQGTPSANAVNIQIFEPKAYASPQPAMQPNYTNPIYNYPQTSMYAPMSAPQYPMPQMMLPQFPAYPQAQAMPQPMQAPAQPVVMQQPQAPIYTEQPQVYTVPPQVVTQPQVQEAAPVNVQQPAQPAQTIDVNVLVAGLQSADPSVQEKNITENCKL